MYHFKCFLEEIPPNLESITLVTCSVLCRTDSDILLSSECEDIAHCDKDIDGLAIECETSDLQDIPEPHLL